MKILLNLSFLALLLCLPVFSRAEMQFPQYLFCISWMDLKTDLFEQKLNEYAMAEIQHQEGDWKFYADVIENRLNSLKLENTKAQVFSSSHSTDFPFEHLSLRLEVEGRPATVDCELRFQRSL